MVTSPLIFPSLSRRPSMDTSKKTEDDTIRDQMEAGYVATRPRFTRARRTWDFNVRNLVAEDIRALDRFFMETAARGGNSFLYPNLLPNSSFEIPASSPAEIVQGWYANVTCAQSIAQINTTALGADVLDGSQEMQFSTYGGTVVPAMTTVLTQITHDQNIPCTPGEVYAFTGYTAAVLAGLTNYVMNSNAAATFFDAYGNSLSSWSGGGAPIVQDGWQPFQFAFTVPANAVSFQIVIWFSLANVTGSPLTLPGGAGVAWDCVGCALQTPVTPYGRMVGSQPLGCPVRFAKLPETADIGWGNGVKVYGATISLTEV
jgi:hypothetical protein